MIFEQLDKLIAFRHRLGLIVAQAFGFFLELLHPLLVAFHLAQRALNLGL